MPLPELVTAKAARLAEQERLPRYKMKFVNDEFISNIPPMRFPAGAVVKVDEDTAIRWFDLGIAVQADDHEPLYAEVLRNQIREAKEREAEEEGRARPKFNPNRGRIYDDTEMPPERELMPTMPRRGRPPKARNESGIVADAFEDES